jgi:hypothetical protein
MDESIAALRDLIADMGNLTAQMCALIKESYVVSGQ